MSTIFPIPEIDHMIITFVNPHFLPKLACLNHYYHIILCNDDIYKKVVQVNKTLCKTKNMIKELDYKNLFNEYEWDDSVYKHRKITRQIDIIGFTLYGPVWDYRYIK